MQKPLNPLLVIAIACSVMSLINAAADSMCDDKNQTCEAMAGVSLCAALIACTVYLGTKY